jgi:hypothetical protein
MTSIQMLVGLVHAEHAAVEREVVKAGGKTAVRSLD